MESTPTNPLPQDESSPTLPSGRPRDHGARLPAIAGYDLLEEVGRGGMGVVYRARQRGLNRIVALKVVLAGAHAGAQGLLRFRAEVLARLEHPNIVKIHDVGESDGVPFYALEFCAGGSLADRLNGTPLPAREAAALVETLARGVQAAHEAGVVHRDLKPGNILLQEKRTQGRKVAEEQKTHDNKEDGKNRDEPADVSFSLSLFPDDRAALPELTPKITDFGIAKQLEDDRGVTRTGIIMGTPEYMAPEQAAGRTRHVGPPADIYSLGVILYECLTGRPPFWRTRLRLGDDSRAGVHTIIAFEFVPVPAPLSRRKPCATAWERYWWRFSCRA